MGDFFKEIENKWQRIWDEKKIFEPEIDESKPKFFLTVPYPYMSGLLHLGSAYTFGRGDFIARFKRLKGFNVLWPQGWHITGAPIVANSLRLREGDPKILKDLKIQKIPKEDWEKLKTPEGWALYFIEKNREAFKKFGFSIDWRREFYTSYLHPWYNKFIEWQYRKLKEKGLVTKGKHPVVWDPKVNAVIGDHDRADEYAGIGPVEGYIIKFHLYSPKVLERLKSFDGENKIRILVLPCFTLRPETVYGVTNIWINPESEYTLAKVNNEYWILPKTIIIEEIKNQGFEVEILEDIDPKAILGEFAENPVTKEKVPILPAKFVDPEVGTGIVMSVPAHAPYDYIALRDIIQGEHFSEFKDLAEKALKSIKSLFVVPEFDVLPAKTIIEKMNIRSQDEKEKLEKATQEIYSKEFYNGVLKDIYGKFAGKKIYEVKDELAKELCNKKIAIKYYTLPIRFKSRYGGVCIVKIVKDQWFIKYSDPEWKKLAHECVDQMKFIPEDIRKILHHTINWLRDWACTHKKELGTPLPWDPEWTIESLSDSTIYMAFYTIAHIIKQIPPEKIEDDLFDYIFLGIGDEKELTEKYGEVVKKMRREFLYWYPVDLRTSGKDLIQNHLTFYIFHHVAIFPKKLWPRAIAINGWVLRDGKKMSKSLGNIILMLDVAKQSIDAIRFLLAYAGNSGLDDANIEFSRVEEVKRELEEWYRFAIENYNKGTEKETLLDKWFENYIYNILLEVEKEYENMNFKNVLVKGWYELENAYRFYIRFTEPSKNILNKYIEFRTLILYPIAPHIASEILEKIKGRDFAIKPSWPEIKEYDQEIAKIRPFIENLRNDIIRVVELLKRKGKKYNNIKIIIASEKKYEIFDKAKEIVSAYGLKELTKRLIEEFGGDVVKLSQKIFKDPGLLNIYLRREWEMEILENIKPKLEEEFNAKIIIEIEEESKEQKAANALPGKPAIILQ